MAAIYEKRENALKYTAKDGDTLESIVKAHPDRFADWSDLASYNWGTSNPNEVNRALLETIGCSKVDARDPSKTILAPHPDGPKRAILLAKPWKAENLAVDKVHTVKAKKSLPASAVGIDTLDKWFIPGRESCGLTYSLEGLAEAANHVTFEVYGSNYCEAGAWNGGQGTFPANADRNSTPLYKHEEQTNAAPRASGLSITEWKGTVTATQGALGKKTPDGAAGEVRVINVAFSPYTALLRYYSDAADKSALLSIDSFWPQFDNAGTPAGASLKLRWNVERTERFKGGKGRGLLLVVDGKGDVVFRKPLKDDELENKVGGSHEFAWDGKYNSDEKKNSKGGNVVILEDMPYRLQVQMHTGPNETKALALAAMHTEVRLYAHPKAHATDLNPYVPETDKSSLVLFSARGLLATKNLQRADGTAWCKVQLAQAGFHPGPVNADAARAEYQAALTEFKRSVPKRKPNAAADFERFILDLTDGNDIKDAMEDLAADPTRQRPWFGNPDANRVDFDLADAAFQARLRDNSKELIVWVDDRHCYTDAAWLAGVTKGPTTRAKIVNDPAAMGNYAGSYTSAADSVVAMKAQAIARPWIPIAVDLPLLSKNVPRLDAEVASFSDDELKDMRKAVGPIRVDWTFDEIDADPPIDDAIAVADYGKTVTRTKAYVEKVAKDGQADYARKDVNRTSKYTNCPVDETAAHKGGGGIRPSALADYYKVALGTGAESLEPWHAVTDGGREAIATVVHDYLGQSASECVRERIGQAGVYFRPSTIAGDGYRVRAQVRFEPVDNYKLPNLAVLKQRYPLLPQAQSARMRLWRKASIRAYLSWSHENHWPAVGPGFMGIHAAAHLHYVLEAGAVETGPLTDYFADDASFRALVKESLVIPSAAGGAEDRRAADANIKLNEKRLWPWNDAQGRGIFESSAVDASRQDAMAGFLNGPINTKFFNLSNLYALAIAQVLEKKKGKLRGHVLGEFCCSDPFFLQRYECPTCGHKWYYAEVARTGNSLVGSNCPDSTCAGKLHHGNVRYVGYYRCASGHEGAWEEATNAGGAYNGANCVTGGCAALLSAVTESREEYTCPSGHWHGFLGEGGAGGDHDGQACPQAGCNRTLVRTGAWKETYVCDRCGVSETKSEPTPQGGSHVNELHASCAQSPKGHFARQAPSPGLVPPPHHVVIGNKVRIEQAEGSGYPGDVLPVPSIGLPLGVAWCSHGDAGLWAHEIGHCRFLEHAGNAPHANGDQHDHEANPFNWAGIGETDPNSMAWDRACLMTYADQLATYNAARDKLYLCGKCVFKMRGWMIEGASLNNPTGVVKDP